MRRILLAAIAVAGMPATRAVAQQAPAGQAATSAGTAPKAETGNASGANTPSATNAPEAMKPEHISIERQTNWTFAGLFGYYDKQQLRRGYKIYKNVCANCHGMRLMYYRNLGQPGGPEFSKEEVEQIAAEAQVTDGPNDQGEMFQRPGKPSDRFAWAFKNDKEAAAANNGALPPDQSVIAKARTVERDVPWYLVPLVMLSDVGTQYQEQGQDYIYALLNGYRDPPPNKTVAAGLYYNIAFPGNQLAMPQPLQDGTVDYDNDTTPNTLDQESRDVVAFLSWASEPHLVERKKLGIWVLVYLSALIVLLFLSKRMLWRNVKH